jgi:uncharacterized protein (TIGR04255 family)
MANTEEQPTVEAPIVHRQYRRNFLAAVLFRIDYSPILTLGLEAPAKFQDAIRDKYPKLEARDVANISFVASMKPGQPAPTVVPNGNPLASKLWMFSRQDGSEIVELSNSSLGITTKKYTSSDEFLSTVDRVVSEFKKVVSPNLTRIGLRYIDIITLKDGSPLEWAGFISNDLTANLRFFAPGELGQAMTQVTLVRDDCRVNFTYGVHNPYLPAPVAKRTFVLDLDCYSEEVTVETMGPTLRKFHDIIMRHFEKSIGDSLRNLMDSNDE